MGLTVTRLGWKSDQDLKDWFAHRSTRRLLAIKSRLYRVNGGQARSGDGYYVNGENYGPMVTLGLLKAELATREHVPNKAEARAIRQSRANESRGCNKSYSCRN